MSFFKIKTKYEITLTEYIEAKNYELACKFAWIRFCDQREKIDRKIKEIPYISRKEIQGEIVNVVEVEKGIG